MPKKAKPPNPVAGRWRLVSMSAWDKDFIDEEEEGYFEFNDAVLRSCPRSEMISLLGGCDHATRGGGIEPG